MFLFLIILTFERVVFHVDAGIAIISQKSQVFPETLVYSKGSHLSKPFTTGTAKEAMDLLDSQNRELDHARVVELTYGPKRGAKREVFLPRYLALDKKVLRFIGYFREETDDWAGESYRIRPVKVLYYLQNDTMEVIEPRTANSGLLQGTLFKRQVFPHPKGKGRRYLWKDLNLGHDIQIYGITIHLTECDQWTREYLIYAGIELNEPEQIPPDPHTEQRRGMEPRKEVVNRNTDEMKLYKFLKCDRKVLRFYGTWQDILSDPPEMRRVILQYYLSDDTMELMEDHVPNCGRDPFKVLIRRQKIPVDRNELPENFPLSYMEIQDEDLRWFQPNDFRTGKDIIILGKKIFLYDCDNFTKHYYKTYLGVEDMESIAVAEKPKPQPPKIIPPHTGIGTWDDSLQNCLSLIPKPQKKNFIQELHFDRVTLRFKARLVSPIVDEKVRRFVFTFYPGDDTLTINEESVPNSGFPGGTFFKRNRLLKQQTDPSVRPLYYEADDFYVGAQVRVSGKVFELTDADPFVSNFMEEHPELYSEEHVKIHKDGIASFQMKPETMRLKEMEIIDKLREHVNKNYGTTPYPLPKALHLGSDLQNKEKVQEELYSANLPIPQPLINTDDSTPSVVASSNKKLMIHLTGVIDLCTDQNNKTDLRKVRKILISALGHNH